jgi:hypothetical protein
METDMREERVNDGLQVTDKMRSDDPLVAAREYIRAGLTLVVTHGITKKNRCTCGDSHCPHPGKHPLTEFFPHGAKSATSDLTLVRRAFRKFPDANLAIAPEGLTIVDIDGPEGKEAVGALELPRTIGVRTGRGIHKYYFGAISGGSFKAHQVDVITGLNRYVMVPPSVHESGILYRWLTSCDQAAPVPEALLDLREGPPQDGRKSIPKRTIRVGERNDFLFRMACSLRRRVDDDATILEMMKVANERLCEEPLQLAELRAAIMSSARYIDKDGQLFGPPQERKPLPMEWLWYPYIPRFGLTILAGDPGRGKSLLSALLIGIVTSKAKWPLSNDRPSGDRVLLLSSEDNWARVTLRRLLKAGANIENIHVMHKFRVLTDERLDQLAEEMETWRPDLVIIDTLTNYMGAGRDIHRQNEVGEFLALLSEMAESTGAAIVGLGHLNKQTSEPPLFRIVGSIGFAATIRSALFLGTDPLDRSRLALAHGKASASEEGKTIVFDLEGGGRDDVPVLRALSFSDATDVDVCQVQRNSVGRPSTERMRAIEFVLEYLHDEKLMPWEAVQRAAEARAIASEGTLNNIRAELAKAGRIIQIGKGRNAKWKLGKQQPQSE